MGTAAFPWRSQSHLLARFEAVQIVKEPYVFQAPIVTSLATLPVKEAETAPPASVEWSLCNRFVQA